MIFQNMLWLTWPTIVADGRADVFGHGVEVADQVLRRLSRQFRMLFQRSIQVLHISAMVHVVMQRHGLLVNNGFESVVSVGQNRYFVSHDFLQSFRDDEKW